MSHADAWLAGVIRRAETVEECQLAVTVYLQERAGGPIHVSAKVSAPTSHNKSLRLVPPDTDGKNATV